MLLRYINISLLLVGAFFTAACGHHQAVSGDAHAPSSTTLAGDRHVLAGEWEYIDGSGAAIRLILDAQGNGHYDWRDGRFETRTLIDHTWNGLWIQEENDREGGFTVEFAPDFSEGEGQWWYSRIGTDTAPSQQGGTFHLKSSIVSGVKHAEGS